jgi:hypothetical protein
LANGLQPRALGFVIDPDNTQVIHAANGSAGVLESLDGGTSWAPINTGIQGLEVRSIGIASRAPLMIYAGLASAGIWKTTRTTIQDFSITINDGAMFTNKTLVTLTLTAPPGTTQIKISNDGGFGSATWETFVNTKPWTITAYGNYVLPRTVYAKFMTNGQTSGQYQDDIILDLNPPTGTLRITDVLPSLTATPGYLSVVRPATDALTNAIYLPMVCRNYVAGYRLVGLALSAADDLSGVDSILISTDATFASAQWQPYVTRKNWYVPDIGTTTVYVKYRDRANNESQVYSAITTAP